MPKSERNVMWVFPGKNCLDFFELSKKILVKSSKIFNEIFRKIRKHPHMMKIKIALEAKFYQF